MPVRRAICVARGMNGHSFHPLPWREEVKKLAQKVHWHGRYFKIFSPEGR